ncbi:MAG: HPr family phosphocarrier protein [Sulfurovum sp.]|nr:MAG: HPr family phosphocarrier protein [Sulfurovum sp.]
MNFLKKIFTKRNKPLLTTLTITSENGLHLRPIAKFVNEVKEFDAEISIIAHNQEVLATQVPKILSLSLEKGETFTLKCQGEEALEASAYLSDFFEKMMQEDKTVEEIVQIKETYEANTVIGKSIAKGIAIAPLTLYETRKISKTKDTGLSIKEAIRRTKEELYDLYQANKTQHEAQIFLAQKELISADVFRYECSTVRNFLEIIKEEVNRLENTRFASRIPDYYDVEQRVLKHLGMTSIVEVPTQSYILLADDLLPSEVMKLQNTLLEGVVLQKGTTTSHSSILLRSFGIPSLIITEPLKASQRVILDANSGNLILQPTNNDIRKALRKQKEFKKYQEESYKKRFESTKTKDNKIIKVLANISDYKSANEAKEEGADGIGLLRTEFLFKEERPSLEEQVESYKNIFKLFNILTVRTLDIGGDKSLPYIKIPKENNPFLGIRGIRFSLQEQTLFHEQILAIYKAFIAFMPSPKNIKIMFPMISTVEEFNRAKEIAISIAEKHHITLSNIEFGIMIEVPSVLFAIEEFNQVVDFYSVGTNDLTQYIFAIERTHPTLIADATSPIILSALKMIAQKADKPISICGELAGLEEVTQELIEMGYETLSVSAKLIPSLKERIRNV